MPQLRTSPEVKQALNAGFPIVGLESTIFSHLGLPSPANREALERVTTAIKEQGAVAAITAVLDGEARVGLEEREWDRILGPAQKTAERDIPIALAQRWSVGATTVSASLALCAAAGIEVFATGGIGGVHIGSEATGDVSSDLGAISLHQVLTVCAGAKAFLDIAKTVEFLETESVPVLGYRTDDFPMFYSRTSGVAVPRRGDAAPDGGAPRGHRRPSVRLGSRRGTAGGPGTGGECHTSRRRLGSDRDGAGQGRRRPGPRRYPVRARADR
jgi:pseudouridine-5'-phosphate glycosidase